MKLYPVTNTIVDGNDAQAEELNKNTQVCFEAANGGLDRHNFPATSLEAKDFQGRTFNASRLGKRKEYSKQTEEPYQFRFTSITQVAL
jgi:hypothetical protein